MPRTVPGMVRSYSTIHSIGIEWDIEGDTNHNAVCKVAYKRSGEASWHETLPLFRIDYAGWYDALKADRPYNMLAGSILFLRPGTAYEVRLSLADPDGGQAEERLTIRTRPIPDRGEPQRTLHVRPGAGAGDGSEGKPFRTLQAADAGARPGDLFLLHAGNYGAVTLTRSGETVGDPAEHRARPVTWKAAGDGPAVFDSLDLNASHVWLEGLTFRQKERTVGLKAGKCAGVVLRGNDFRGFHYSVLLGAGSEGWYIADNDIVGDAPTGISGEGIELNHTSHHTVCYNRISKQADGISYAHRNCDLFGNDIFDVSDDCLEPDYGYANIRMWGNRLHGPVGISFQPMYCGPWYLVRNQVLSTGAAFKLRVQDRFLTVNNTFVGWGQRSGSLLSHAHGLLSSFSRNNLWIHAGGSEFLWTVQAPDNAKQRDYFRKYVIFDTFQANWRTDMDHDGFDWSAAIKQPRLPARDPFIWSGVRIYDLPSLAHAVGIEKHGRAVERRRIFAAYDLPGEPAVVRPVLTLRADGEAIDAGVPVPNLAETFRGKAPDLGAHEHGQDPPHYGPRDTAALKRYRDYWVVDHQKPAPVP